MNGPAHKSSGSRPLAAGARRPADRFDEAYAAWLAKPSGGLPLPRILQAYGDWLANLAQSPGRQIQIAEMLVRSRLDLLKAVFGSTPEIHDSRFSGDAWKRKPFALLAQAAIQRESLCDAATQRLPGMERHNAALVHFYTRQWLEALSPSNWPLTNPEVLAATRQQRGRNLVKGARNLFRDAIDALRGKPGEPGRFRVGENLATTPGKVVLRNGLMELIQYAPKTPAVFAEPVLIVPAWIMKYYILDLSPHNSLVSWLVGQGHTVFVISWKNPGAEDRNLSMDDYRCLGVHAALDALRSIVPSQKVHAVGYCVGGTLLAIAAAARASDSEDQIKTLTLLAAQTDFEDAGELKLFVDEMTLHWLDARMAKAGFLDSSQMAAAFHLLRSRDLIWSKVIRDYWLGERGHAFDIMAWNADGTRMPHRMHIDYLRQLYLENQLAQGKYQVGGRAVSIGDIAAPLFVVGTSTDHVAPWRSVYKIRNLKRRGDTTFVLTTGGHNAGIVSPPGPTRRSYHIGSWNESTPYQDSKDWVAAASAHEGSWWPAWQAWLAGHSGAQVAPPPMGNAGEGFAVLGDAPGTYVFER